MEIMHARMFARSNRILVCRAQAPNIRTLCQVANGAFKAKPIALCPETLSGPPGPATQSQSVAPAQRIPPRRPDHHPGAASPGKLKVAPLSEDVAQQDSEKNMCLPDHALIWNLTRKPRRDPDQEAEERSSGGFCARGLTNCHYRLRRPLFEHPPSQTP